MPLPRPPRRRRTAWAAASLTAAAALLAGAIPAVAGPAPTSAAVDSALDKAVSQGGDATFFVVLKDRADLLAAKKQRTHAKAATAAYKALKSHAAESQKPLTAFLDKEKVGHEDYWIANAVKVRGDQDLVERLAKRPDVKELVKSRTYRLDGMETSDAKVSDSRTTAEGDAVGDATPAWGISDIKADQVWDQYEDRGEGIVVASVDSGVQADHPDLAANYRGNNGDGTVTNDYNFYDATGTCATSSTPCDDNGHGTHTMGTIAGKNGIGVAPNARWMAAKACAGSRGECVDADTLAAGQWILAPTDRNGQNPRPDLAPNIVNNSWGGGQTTFYQDIVEAWNSAGIFEAFAAGNDGDGKTCSTTAAPGAQAPAYGVGAYDSAGTIADFSGFGPSLVDGSAKPNISAPGVDITSAWPGGSYNTISGTSMATPHVAGSVALLWSAAPSLISNIDETRRLLDEGARDVDDTHCGGTAGMNNVWGEGKLDILASVAKAPRDAVDVTGRITDKDTGEAVSGITVKAAGADGDHKVTTGPQGTYKLALVPGTYDFTVAEYGYATRTLSGVELTSGSPLTQDIALTVLPRHAVTGTVLDVTGKPLAKARVEIPGTPVDSVTSGSDGTFTLPKVAEGTYTLSVTPTEPLLCNGGYAAGLTVDGDENRTVRLPERSDHSGNSCAPATYSWIPGSTKVALSGDEDARTVALPFPVTFYGVKYTSAAVTTNGLVNFLSPRLGDYANEALPTEGEPNGIVAPLWDDLSLDKKSSVQTATTGTTGNRKFAVVWNNALFANGERATFEAVFDEASGAIDFQYKAVPGAGASATVGIENQAGTDALQYAHNQAVLTAGSAIRIAQGAK
ncbi:S8 family serine peptidase [Streptomyces sp. NPDC059897]|uniref:S8 family serine peptidase n=1 Tax=Streptomyces sp. NPDC059897 TaxID=3346994 RepID=UPI003661362A